MSFKATLLQSIAIWLVVLVALGNASGCGGSGGNSGGASNAVDPELPLPSEFVDYIDNPYFPHEPGTTFIYEGMSPDGFLHTDTDVTYELEMIMGVACTVVRSTEYLNGMLVEATDDWYAQDLDGNVWYFGEDTQEYDTHGDPIFGSGSWRAGVGNARPGIIMLADPRVGEPAYRQEDFPGFAEDWAIVEALDAVVRVPYGGFESCLQTEEYTPLDPTEKVLKYYALEVGHVLETALDGSERLELVDVFMHR